ncbi:spore coat-associated protein N [Bacillus pakistanensis]|uniref:Spore coat-associated protein N n=1 Tax=Rossellomorea pakistanensis TaxID=992288 RepID=A0ABS2NBP6_9BACI|nr:CalY family protein [Bacillus pakistanensis]MBM7585292.1 spore coat-associated protein N [Bacillus pakistanensis]
MNLKKKLGMGVASAALGLSLVGGGTYAYFSDTATSTNTFAAGTLDLSVDPQEIINVDNIKPGDTMLRSFELVNGGTLDIKDVVINTDYAVTDAKGDNVGDFGEHIRVNFMFNVDKLDVPVWSTTLADLKGMSPEAVKDQFEHLFGDEWGSEGLVAGSSDLLYVQFEFDDNGADQNEFQGDSLELTWNFVGSQTEGEER